MRPFDDDKQITSFRESRIWTPGLNINSDIVFVYGTDRSSVNVIKSWREHGYSVGLLANFSHGDISDWLNGKYDNNPHWDEVQTDRDGKPILYSPSIPYVVPSVGFTEYYIAKILPLLETGIECVCIEEPEFSARAGYSKTFKTEWELFYRTPWQAPHTSTDAQYKASVLKAFLITRAIDRIATVLKYEAKTIFGRNLKIYVSQSSSVESSATNVICPSAQLSRLNSIDGFVGKVRADCSDRSIANQGGDDAVFRVAFLQYGLLHELSINSGKDMIFEIPPISKDSTVGWTENRRNYEKILTAALLQGDVRKFEACPMPHRVLLEKYPRRADTNAKFIPEAYKTELMSLLSVLRDIGKYDCVKPEKHLNVGAITSDTSMYQRVYPDGDKYERAYSEGIDSFAAFYGICAPLLKCGIPVHPISVETTDDFCAYINSFDVLILSYQYMKPESARLHFVLSDWIRRGGILFIVSDCSDTFNSVESWWNSNGNAYSAPEDHLFEILGLKHKVAALYKKNSKTNQVLRGSHEGLFSVGDGYVGVLGENPQFCALEKSHSAFFCQMFNSAVAKKGLRLPTISGFELNRGPYRVVSIPTFTEKGSVPLSGTFVNLFSPNLDVETFIVLDPGTSGLLYDIDKKSDDSTEIIAISAKVSNYTEEKNEISFDASAIPGMNCVCRLFCPDDAEIRINDELVKYSRDDTGKTILFTFKGSECSQIKIKTIQKLNGDRASGKKN